MKSLRKPVYERRFALWYGALGGGAAWTAHLLLAYLIAEFGCVGRLHHFAWMGIMTPAWMILGVSVLLLLVSLLATAAAWRAWSLLRHLDVQHERRAGADGYLALGGLWCSGLFTLIIAVQTIPIFFYLRGC